MINRKVRAQERNRTTFWLTIYNATHNHNTHNHVSYCAKTASSNATHNGNKLRLGSIHTLKVPTLWSQIQDMCLF